MEITTHTYISIVTVEMHVWLITLCIGEFVDPRDGLDAMMSIKYLLLQKPGSNPNQHA
jgi:hypothetical protein